MILSKSIFFSMLLWVKVARICLFLCRIVSMYGTMSVFVCCDVVARCAFVRHSCEQYFLSGRPIMSAWQQVHCFFIVGFWGKGSAFVLSVTYPLQKRFCNVSVTDMFVNDCFSVFCTN